MINTKDYDGRICQFIVNCCCGSCMTSVMALDAHVFGALAMCMHAPVSMHPVRLLQPVYYDHALLSQAVVQQSTSWAGAEMVNGRLDFVAVCSMLSCFSEMHAPMRLGTVASKLCGIYAHKMSEVLQTDPMCVLLLLLSPGPVSSTTCTTVANFWQTVGIQSHQRRPEIIGPSRPLQAVGPGFRSSPRLATTSTVSHDTSPAAGPCSAQPGIT